MLRAPLLSDAPETVASAAQRAERYAADGFRVLAIAQSDRPAADLKDRTAHGLERNLRLLGLIAILDPPRAAAAARPSLPARPPASPRS